MYSNTSSDTLLPAVIDCTVTITVMVMVTVTVMVTPTVTVTESINTSSHTVLFAAISEFAQN